MTKTPFRQRTTALFVPRACYAPICSLLFTLSAAAALFAMNVHAATPTESTNPAAEAAAAPSTPAAPKYATQDVERAFGFIDVNHDGKISREEAVPFKNVTKYFDAADLNRDNFLSPAEFHNALNGSRPQ
jgi:hypothetical protein